MFFPEAKYQTHRSDHELTLTLIQDLANGKLLQQQRGRASSFINPTI